MSVEAVADVVVDGVNAEEEAAYLAEMGSPVEEEDAEQAPSAQEEASQEVEAQAEPEAEAEPERKEVLAGYTEDEIKAALTQVGALQKALDTTNGTYGAKLAEQQRVIEELRQQRSSVGALSAEKFKRLSQEYPEIAEMLAADLSENMSLGGASSVDMSQVQQLVDARAQALQEQAEAKERQREIRTLTKQHGDWQQIATYKIDPDTQALSWNNPEFGKFVGGLSVDEQNKLLTELDADFIATKISEFKEVIKPKPVVKKQTKQLEAAVLPKGIQGRQVTTELDDEEAAYRAEMASG